MLITCPECATSYEVAASTLGAGGRAVRCVRCRAVWTATAPQEHARALAEAAESIGASFQAGNDIPEAPLVTENILPESPEPPVESAEPVYEGVDDRGPIDILQSPPLVPLEPVETPDTSAPLITAMAPEIPPPEPPLERPIPREIAEHEEIVQRRAKRIMTRKTGSIPGIVMPAAIFCLMAVIAGLLLWRKDVVRLAPQTASLYSALGLKVNLRDLRLTNVTSSVDDQDAVPVLIVEGQIIGEGRLPVEVPRLRFSIRNASGYEIYTWTALASRMVLGRGEATTFRTRLASPPPDGRDIVVRFFNRRDLVSGTR